MPFVHIRIKGLLRKTTYETGKSLIVNWVAVVHNLCSALCSTVLFTFQLAFTNQKLLLYTNKGG